MLWNNYHICLSWASASGKSLSLSLIAEQHTAALISVSVQTRKAVPCRRPCVLLLLEVFITEQVMKLQFNVKDQFIVTTPTRSHWALMNGSDMCPRFVRPPRHRGAGVLDDLARLYILVLIMVSWPCRVRIPPSLLLYPHKTSEAEPEPTRF